MAISESFAMVVGALAVCLGAGAPGVTSVLPGTQSVTAEIPTVDPAGNPYDHDRVMSAVNAAVIERDVLLDPGYAGLAEGPDGVIVVLWSGTVPAEVKQASAEWRKEGVVTRFEPADYSQEDVHRALRAYTRKFPVLNGYAVEADGIHVSTEHLWLVPGGVASLPPVKVVSKGTGRTYEVRVRTLFEMGTPEPMIALAR